MRTNSTGAAGSIITRRRLAQAAWAAPVILATTTVPAYAASKIVPTTEATFFAFPSADEDQASGIRRPSLGLWFGAPEDLNTGQPLGGTTTLSAGSTFTLTLTMEYGEGQEPTGPGGWLANGGSKEYPANGHLVEFGTPEINSVPIRLDYIPATVTGNTWKGTVTVTTLAEISAIGDNSGLGPSVLIASGLSIDAASIEAGSLILTPGIGSFLVQATSKTPKNIPMSEVRSLVVSLKDVSFDGSSDNQARKA